MIKSLFLLFFIALFLSCGKDNSESKPLLTLNSVSSTTVPAFSDLQISMQLKDNEGDFLNTIWVKKLTTRCPPSNFADSQLYNIPASVPRTNNFDGEVIVTFTYNDIQPKCTRPDTAIFSFWMKDLKGNVSDTVRTPPIIILRP